MESHPSSLAEQHEGRPPHTNPPPPPPLGSLYLGSDGQRYGIALKVAESSSHSPRVPYVGHECMDIAKYQKMCWIITQTQTIIWVPGRETDLIVVQYMEYELEMVLHSLQSVKSS